MTDRTGRFALIEQFVADGFHFMFGNPGTVEQGFLDAMVGYPALKFVLALQESVAVLMADGYARAAHRPALVQLHSSPGIGNAVGALYQAKRGHSPLVVIGGDAGVRYMNMDAQMAADLVGMMEPVTKYSTMVVDPSSLLRVVRRAIKIAATPPMGPVYVCLPMDILDAPAVEMVQPTVFPSTRVSPDDQTIRQIAAWLLDATSPAIFVGDGVAFSDAQMQLTRVAELVGAAVWDVDSGEVNMAYDHPCYQGATGHMFGYHSQPLISRSDFNLICGTYMVPEVFPELGPLYSPGSKTVHIDLNAYEIAKNHPVDVGIVADPRTTLGLLANAIESMITQAQRDRSAGRLADLGAAREEARQKELAADQARRDQTPLHMSRFMEELAPLLPSDAIVFDEALTNSPPIARYFPPRKTGDYFLTRGGSLGVGFPGSVGVKLAHPDRTVIGFSGDGGSMYTIQALWSAARHDAAVKFVVCNNGSYRLLQANIDAYWQERRYATHDYPLSFDLSKPAIKFDEIARSMGVQSVRVQQPYELRDAIRQALAYPGPFLIDLVLEGVTHPELIGVHCGQ